MLLSNFVWIFFSYLRYIIDKHLVSEFSIHITIFNCDYEHVNFNIDVLQLYHSNPSNLGVNHIPNHPYYSILTFYIVSHPQVIPHFCQIWNPPKKRCYTFCCVHRFNCIQNNLLETAWKTMHGLRYLPFLFCFSPNISGSSLSFSKPFQQELLNFRFFIFHSRTFQKQSMKLGNASGMWKTMHKIKVEKCL